jgi:hypothetical protein
MTTDKLSTVPEPLKDLASVLQAIQNLPEPRPGTVRVFRGQNGNYPMMLASGSRPQRLINCSLFNMATRVVAQNLFQQIDSNLELNMMLFWTQAIGQHYGPGSSYLDVTHSLDVALWFALHEYRPVEVGLVYGSGAQVDPAKDILRKETWVTYPRWEKTAYLYVFDVPKWKPGERVEHGHLIDLAEAPPVFSSSPRMRAQSACLIASGWDPAKADLSDCYAVPPIPIAWPMIGAPKLGLVTEDIFPGPEVDDWYKRFLSILLVPQPDRSTPPQITMTHPLPITTYLPQQQERAQDVLQCEVGLHDPLIYMTVGNPTLDVYDPASQQSSRFSMNDATVVVVESPLRFILPPAGHEGWNQRLLWSDISDSVPVYDAPNHAVGSVSLQNVLVEFSPLENPGLSEALRTGSAAELLRAAWLVRNGSGLSVTLFIQSFPAYQIAGATLHRIVMDRATGTIRYESGTGDAVEWKDLTEMEVFAKPVFTILLILREISPLLKAAPFPDLVFGAGTDEQKMMVRISKEAARLLRVLDTRTSRPLHFLRNLGLDEAFVGPRAQGGLKFEVNEPYSKLDAEWIRGTVADNAEAFEAAHENVA